MKWTTAKPTTPGWYWHRGPSYGVLGMKRRLSYVGIVHIVRRRMIPWSRITTLFVAEVGELSGACLTQWGGEWSSCPVPRPEEG